MDWQEMIITLRESTTAPAWGFSGPD